MCAHQVPREACEGHLRGRTSDGESMRRHPEDWAAFERKRTRTESGSIHPARRLVSAVREQPVIAHADAEAPGNNPQHDGREIAPASM